MKQWAGVPRVGTNLIFHMQQGLEIPTISQLYEEAHCINHTAMRLKGDPVVNAAMDNAIKRGAQFLRKGFAIVRAQEVHEVAMHKNCEGGEFPHFDDSSNKEIYQLTKKINETVKGTLKHKAQESNIEHLKTLVMQGEFLKFSLQERSKILYGRASCGTSSLALQSF